MTSSVQTSIIFEDMPMPFIKSSRRSSRYLRFYQATVTDFDGCDYDLDAEACSFEEASASIEAQAANMGIQVYNINLYLVA